MNWFRSQAPIRQKLATAFGLFVGLLAITVLANLLTPAVIAALIGILALVAGGALALILRETIAGPYVDTVVRMEALAAGDLDSPIAYTDYQDCVGRLTRAMFAFRDAAKQEILLARQQGEVVADMGANLKQLAAGNLGVEITTAYPESYVELKHSFNEAVANLRELIGSVATTANHLKTSSQEIAGASEDLARRTESNAASLEETSAAVSQMDGRLKASSEAASQTVHRASQTAETVQEGRLIVDHAVSAMKRVSDSAAGIDAVIEGLDKIAFQTRVLAMNAAVESGRAGDAGRGFAVVADLVSALAMRAEEEARRAREQIGVVQTEIEGAVGTVLKVDGALTSISDSVGDVHTLLRQLASDNEAQAHAIGEIRNAVGVMDQTTQQNAAMVEETSAAAKQMDGQVTGLLDHTATFHLGEPRRSGPVGFVPQARRGAASMR